MCSAPWWCDGVADTGDVPGDRHLDCPPFPVVEAAPTDPALVAAGWQPRFLADAARGAEAAELYRALGFDVRAEPVPPDVLGAYCEGCQVAVCQSFALLYTRPTGSDDASRSRPPGQRQAGERRIRGIGR